MSKTALAKFGKYRKNSTVNYTGTQGSITHPINCWLKNVGYFYFNLRKQYFESDELPGLMMDLGLFKIILGFSFSYFQPLRGSLTLQGTFLFLFKALWVKANLTLNKHRFYYFHNPYKQHFIRKCTRPIILFILSNWKCF